MREYLDFLVKADNLNFVEFVNIIGKVLDVRDLQFRESVNYINEEYAKCSFLSSNCEIYWADDEAFPEFPFCVSFFSNSDSFDRLEVLKIMKSLDSYGMNVIVLE